MSELNIVTENKKATLAFCPDIPLSEEFMKDLQECKPEPLTFYYEGIFKLTKIWRTDNETVLYFGRVFLSGENEFTLSIKSKAEYLEIGSRYHVKINGSDVSFQKIKD